MKIIISVGIVIALLAGVSVYTYNEKSPEKNLPEVSEIEKATIETLNSKIEVYVGDKEKEQSVEMLIKTTNMYNANDMFPSNLIITNKSELLIEEGEKEYKTYKVTATKEQKEKYYKIEIEYDDKGYVKEIIISDAD